MALVTAFRIASHMAFAKAGDAFDVAFYDRLAIAVAWSTALIMGFVGAYSTISDIDDSARLLAIAQTIAYIAGITSRNTSRPFLTKTQASIASLPFIGALLWNGHFAEVTIALSVLWSLMITLSSAGALHRVFVSDFHKARELAQQAVTDSITPLLNRRGFLQGLKAKMDAGGPVSVLTIDVDGFKGVNDTFGHDVGDALLNAMASKIAGLAHSEDAVARVGGDEFMIATCRTALEAEALAAGLVALFNEPVEAGQALLSISVSVGVANVDDATIEQALKRCDLAVYQAKAQGKNRWMPYDASFSVQYDRRMEMDRALRLAVTRGEIDVHFQPIYDRVGGRPLSAEALMRWNCPGQGMVSPGQFIPLAEQNGMITSLGRIALERAVAAALTWPEEMTVSVNVSPKQFGRDHDIVGTVRQVLETSGIAPGRVILEFTESTLADDYEHVVAALNELKALGVKIALDDFGTGYSSLSCIAKLPIDRLKIDRSFIRNIETCRQSQALMRAITSLAADLNMAVIVEGVETLGQLDAIKPYPVHGIQGYLFNRPMPREELDRVLSRHAIDAAAAPISQLDRRSPRTATGTLQLVKTG